MSKFAIITGVTSGIGKAIAEELHGAGYKIHGIARDLKKVKALGGLLSSHEISDLSDASCFGKLLNEVDVTSWDEVVLVNNAGTLNPIAPVTGIKLKDLQSAVNLNQLAPIFLSQKFYAALIKKSRAGRKARIVNISTGAAFHGYAGWTAYCSTKAALWLFTQCFAVEMDQKICQIVALAPGVVETNMQVQIRAQKECNFPDVERFREMKDQGKVFSTSVPAKYLRELLQRDPFPHGQHLDLRK